MCSPISSPCGCGILLSDFIVIFFRNILNSGCLFGETYEPKIGFHKLSFNKKQVERLTNYMDVATKNVDMPWVPYQPIPTNWTDNSVALCFWLFVLVKNSQGMLQRTYRIAIEDDVTNDNRFLVLGPIFLVLASWFLVFMSRRARDMFASTLLHVEQLWFNPHSNVLQLKELNDLNELTDMDELNELNDLKALRESA